MKKEVWHTDIVVSGQGMNVKVIPKSRPGACAKVVLMPDVPGKEANKARARFMKEVMDEARELDSCNTGDMKKAVGVAVKKTRARWNKWHRESY